MRPVRALQRRLVWWAAGLSTAVSLVLVLVVHTVIDATAQEQATERLETFTVWISAAAGVAMAVLATFLASWASRRALAPVLQMARTAAAWSDHDLGRRFDLGPPTDEIRVLGQTLDGLLDRVAGAIAGEQRLTSELAHELRTPLTAIQATADLVAMRADLDQELRADIDDIRTSCRAMAATMTSLLDIARTHTVAGGATCSARDVVANALGPLDARRVVVDVDETLRVAAPEALAARALAPVLDNACRSAGHVLVTASRAGTALLIVVADDGPGIRSGDREAIFAPGHTGSKGTGLGLPLARRIARSVGGDVQVDHEQPTRGARFVVMLPAA